MKKIKNLVLFIALFMSAISFAQSTINSFATTLPMKSKDNLQIFNSIGLISPYTFTGSPSTISYTSSAPFNSTDALQIYNGLRMLGAVTPTAGSWGLSGNTTTNFNYLGTNNNTSLNIFTNNTNKLKLDSLGFFRLRNTTSDGYFHIAPFIGAPTLWMVHIGCAVRTNINYSIGGDSTITVYNSPSDFVIKSKGTNMYFANSYANNSQAYHEWFGMTTNSVTAAEKRRFSIAGNTIQFNTGNWTRQRSVYIQGDVYSAVASSTLTNPVTLEVDAPIQSTNMTFSAPIALRVNGTMSVSLTSTLTNLIDNGTFSVSGQSTLAAVRATGNVSVTGTFSAGGASTVTGNFTGAANISSTSKTAGVGYAVGSGSTVTQATSRVTGVTINAVTGSITLFNTAGSAAYQSFTVTNSAVAINDIISVVQRSGTDLYIIEVTAVSAGSFRITFATTGGTTSEAPVFNFAVIKGQTN